MLFPVGTSVGRSRLPVATLGLIAVNVLVYSLVSGREQLDTRRLYQAASRLASVQQRIEAEHLGAAAGDPEEQDEQQERFWEAFERGEVVSREGSEYLIWSAASAELAAARESHIFSRYGFRITRTSFVTLISSMFLHADSFHLLGNMLFLWTVGASMEEVWGRRFFVALYFIGGLAALTAQSAAEPHSDLPAIGASGAVAAVMGAFLVRHFNARIRFYYFVGIVGRFMVRAGVILPVWLALQVLGALGSKPGEGGVAFWAHIGGFGLGAGAGLLLRAGRVEETAIRPRLEAEDRRRQKAELMERAAFHHRRYEPAEELLALQAAAAVDGSDLDLKRRVLEHLVRVREPDVEGIERLADELLRALWQAGQRQAFLELFKRLRSLARPPRLQPGHLYRAALALETAEPRAAAELLWELVDRHPRDRAVPQALARYAELLDRLGQPSHAAEVRALRARRFPHD